jgi:hypothetical protein
VALDCALFMQNSVHSEFQDPKQIAATVRFDTEEAISNDITDVALAFKVLSSDSTGSNLNVFTAKRAILSEIIQGLQKNNIDPTSIEPDVNCLSRFIKETMTAADNGHNDTLFGILGRSNGYFLGFSDADKQSVMRTFMVRSVQSRADLLSREIPVTIALAGSESQIKRVKIFDCLNSVDSQQLKNRISADIENINLTQVVPTSDNIEDCEPVGFAIAYGAAMAVAEKAQYINFRNDFMPHLGKKVMMESSLKFLGISLLVFVISIGMYFQIKLYQKNRPRRELHTKLIKEYSQVMMGKKPQSGISPVKKLQGELKRLESVKSGQLSGGEESISAKLTLILKAFNNCASQTKLNIDSISVTDKTIRVVGDTSDGTATLKLFEELKKNGLEKSQERLESKNGRNTFTLTIQALTK